MRMVRAGGRGGWVIGAARTRTVGIIGRGSMLGETVARYALVYGVNCMGNRLCGKCMGIEGRIGARLSKWVRGGLGRWVVE